MNTIIIHGFVPSRESTHAPSSVEPTVGTNILHVMSAASLSIKSAAFLTGGVFMSASLPFGCLLMYVYTIPAVQPGHNMPRRNHTPKLARRPIPLRSCKEKRTYRSEADAAKAADLQMLMSPSVELSVYHCHDCKYWHLTSKK